MDNRKDIRWKQRFSNYKKALNSLKNAVDLSKTRTLTDLEKQGMIQAFEFTHELCWKTMKDFILERGNEEIYGSKDAVREAFNLGLIHNGEDWMKMIESRNRSSHTYNNEVADEVVESIIKVYFDLFNDFENTMDIHV
jgi:nucleotidyltransferase substrate binding protein (TIGR01987 family)